MSFDEEHFDEHHNCDQEIKALEGRLAEANKETEEQARLNGMGAERELALMARLEEAKAEIGRLKEQSAKSICTHDSGGTTNAAYPALKAALAAAKED